MDPPVVPETHPIDPAAHISTRELTPDHLIERDIVLQNTLKNAGRRRSSSSNVRPATARRASQHYSETAVLEPEPISPRLKWDEANLYLTEQERTPKMKIDEPKTPFAKGYDPTEDEDELRMLDDESGNHRRHVTPDMNIPDLDLGEPSEHPAPKLTRKESQSPKQVVVKEECEGDELNHHHHHTPGEGKYYTAPRTPRQSPVADSILYPPNEGGTE